MDHDSFYRAWHPRLFGYLARMTGDRELSLDIAQESFARCLARYGGLEDARPVLFAIARNLVFDHHRRSGREFLLDPEPVADSSTPDPEEALLQREASRRLLKALESLPAPEREVLSLAVGRSLSYQEIARICGISEANVKVRVHRARRKLRSLLEEEP
ncbi:MAG: RNA polymerase sigma factor [Proteobacteria bacterium]|nr:RNA polymerase sigma factor [Pseudomonadota bacterium]